MNEQNASDEKEQKAPLYHAVIATQNPDFTTLVSSVGAPNRTTLRKILQERNDKFEVIAIYRGKKLPFETKKRIDFV